MPVDEKEIKSALDAFETEDFIVARERLKSEIVKAKNDFLKTRLGLEKDIYPAAMPAPEPIAEPEPEPDTKPEPKKRRLTAKK
jgi:hypothetical protein